MRWSVSGSIGLGLAGQWSTGEIEDELIRTAGTQTSDAIELDDYAVKNPSA